MRKEPRKPTYEDASCHRHESINASLSEDNWSLYMEVSSISCTESSHKPLNLFIDEQTEEEQTEIMQTTVIICLPD